MILEVAILNVKAGQGSLFEAAFQKAEPIIAAAKGYISHEFRKCVEVENQYLLLVYWQSIEDHEVGFRSSAPYLEWKKLLHPFYDPFPIVQHYMPLLKRTLR